MWSKSAWSIILQAQLRAAFARVDVLTMLALLRALGEDVLRTSAYATRETLMSALGRLCEVLQMQVDIQWKHCPFGWHHVV